MCNAHGELREPGFHRLDEDWKPHVELANANSGRIQKLELGSCLRNRPGHRLSREVLVRCSKKGSGCRARQVELVRDESCQQAPRVIARADDASDAKAPKLVRGLVDEPFGVKRRRVCFGVRPVGYNPNLPFEARANSRKLKPIPVGWAYERDEWTFR